MAVQRRRNLVAALGFLQLEPRAPELRLLHRWLDTWTGLGLIVVGVERQGLRFSLSHIGEDEWRATFMAHPMFAQELRLSQASQGAPDDGSPGSEARQGLHRVRADHLARDRAQWRQSDEAAVPYEQLP
jgi:hypothetical protein